MPLTANGILDLAAAAAPNRVALTLDDDRMTFGQIREWTHRHANAIAGIGVCRGDRVASWTDVSLSSASLQLGIGRLGAAWTPLNPKDSDEDVRAALEYLAPRLLVVDAAREERARELARQLDLEVARLASSETECDGIGTGASADPPSSRGPAATDIFNIFLTSGTTGRAKGVMISQRATRLRSQAGGGAHVTTGGPGSLISFPLHHMSGWAFIFDAWSAHRPAHLVRRADPEMLLSALERHSASSLYCIPGVWRRLVDARPRRTFADLEWAMTGTARFEIDLIEAIRRMFPNARTTVSYGSTEVGRTLALSDSDAIAKHPSVGLPVPGIEVRIGDDGELLVASPTMMSGYFGLPAESEAAFDGEWYRTGDLVERDEDGYVSIVGRRREMVRSGAEWVAPIEVEAALSDYPGVVEVAVIGAPDPTWGEVVCALLVMAPGVAPPTVDELRRHIGGRLTANKHPRRVLVVDGLPRTSVTGRVQRAGLAYLATRGGGPDES